MNNSLRVMQLLPALGDGGVERNAVEMTAFLGARGIANWVASDGGPLVAAIASHGATHIPLRVGAKSPVAMIANARALARVIEAEQIDIVHALSRAPAWAGWMASRMARRKCHFLTTFHGTYSHQNALKRFYNGAMLKGRLVIANSLFIRDHIHTVYGYPLDRIVVAPRGLDPAVFEPVLFTDSDRQEMRSALGATGDTPLLVMVGRLTDWKGHGVLVEALAKVKDLDWQMAFVGGGNDGLEADLKSRIAGHGLDSRIHWTGSRRDIPAILAASDLAFSASTRPEAFGLASIEAQAMQTPVIATDHGGSRETVIAGETGWLVAPKNPDAIADAIRTALADPARLGQMGTRARENILANFTAANMLQREFSAYTRLMTDDGPT
jgi:glycosyltransferase involved in cell wall biosynthesis